MENSQFIPLYIPVSFPICSWLEFNNVFRVHYPPSPFLFQIFLKTMFSRGHHYLLVSPSLS